MLLELCPPKWLREDVCDVVTGLDIDGVKETVCYHLAKAELAVVDVLGFLV